MRKPKELQKEMVSTRIMFHYKEFIQSEWYKENGIPLGKLIEWALVKNYRKNILDNTSVEIYELAGENGIELPELSEPEIELQNGFEDIIWNVNEP